MNCTPQPELENPWQKRSELPRLPISHTVTSVLALLIASLGLPFFSYEWVAVAMLAYFFFYVVYTAKTPFTVTVILVTAVLTVLFGGTLQIGAFVMALLIGTMSCCFLLTASRLRWFSLLIPVLAFAAAAGITQSPIWALLALAFVPSALLLAYATLSGRGRTSAICFSVLGFVLVVLGVLAAVIATVKGGLGREQILSSVNDAREWLLALLQQFRDLMLESTEGVLTEQTGEVGTRIMEVLSDEALTEVVAQLFNILPGLLVVLFSVISFEAQMLLNAGYHRAGLDAVLTREARFLTVSVSAAVLYAVSFLLMLVLPLTSIASAVAQNLALILMPILCVMGIQGLLLSLSRSRGGLRMLLIMMILFLLCCSGGSALYILGMWGAYTRIMLLVQQKMLEKMGGGQPPSNG